MARTFLTAGQASGATDVPLGTLRRYVASFSDHFSDSARIPNRGRRFSDKDIELVLKVRRLYNRGLNEAEVAKVLVDGWKPDEMTQREVADAVRVTNQANELLERTQLIVQSMRLELSGHREEVKKLAGELRIYTERSDHNEVVIPSGPRWWTKVLHFLPVGLLCVAFIMIAWPFKPELSIIPVLLSGVVALKVVHLI